MAFQARFVPNKSKIGIRPCIDGRRDGVRESLEEQTQLMANEVKKLLESKLFYPDGSPVQCVIPKQNISGTFESKLADQFFEKENVGLTITVTPCWCYGAETMDMHPSRPKAVWGFNGTERPGAVYLAAVLAAHAQKGLPAFSIYGRDVQDSDTMNIPEDVEEKLLRFARAGLVVAMMQGQTYLGIGGVSMGIAGSMVNSDFIEDYLGMRLDEIDMSEIKRRIDKEIYDPEEFKLAKSWADKNFKRGMDPNGDKAKTSEQIEKDWEFSIKMCLVARDLMLGNKALIGLGYEEESQGHQAIAGGFQGQRQWTDHYPNGDMMEAVLNTSFDWTGSREPISFATENDSLNALSMLWGKYLTGTAQIFSDVRTYWSPEAVKRVAGVELKDKAKNGFLHLINSGPTALDASGAMKNEKGDHTIKPWWESTEVDRQACLDACEWCPSVLEYFPGGGYSTRFKTKGGLELTMARISLVKGQGPVLQIAEGWSIELDPKTHDLLDQRTNPTWPTTWFVPRTNGEAYFKDVYTVMSVWGANHGSISIGHIGADLIALASMLRIPVSMHNVSDDKIFRPSSWNLLGSNRESSDFRACDVYGPLYGKAKR